MGDCAMNVTDELLRNNEAYASSFDKGALPLPPGKKCGAGLHGREVEPYGALGLKEGDAHVIRNAAASSQMTRSARWRSPSGCSVPRRSSSSITPTAECSPSPTTSSEADPGRDRHQAAVGRSKLSGISTRTFASRSPASRRARSFRRSTRFGDRLRRVERRLREVI